MLRGPDYPAVWHDPLVLRAWFAARLTSERGRTGNRGHLWLRGATTGATLEAAQFFFGLRNGIVVAKRQAGERLIENLANQYRRIIEDSLNYRAGVTTSLYWGPFERRQDVRALVRELAGRAAPRVEA